MTLVTISGDIGSFRNLRQFRRIKIASPTDLRASSMAVKDSESLAKDHGNGTGPIVRCNAGSRCHIRKHRKESA